MERTTPRPWRAGDDDNPKPRYILAENLRDDTGLRTPVAETHGWRADADAALIVEAVNAYDRLRAIEAAASALVDTIHDAFGGTALRIPNPGQRRAIIAAASDADAALRGLVP